MINFEIFLTGRTKNRAGLFSACIRVSVDMLRARVAECCAALQHAASGGPRSLDRVSHQQLMAGATQLVVTGGFSRAGLGAARAARRASLSPSAYQLSYPLAAAAACLPTHRVYVSQRSSPNVKSFSMQTTPKLLKPRFFHFYFSKIHYYRVIRSIS